jgi:hypothetical protein
VALPARHRGSGRTRRHRGVRHVAIAARQVRGAGQPVLARSRQSRGAEPGRIHTDGRPRCLPGYPDRARRFGRRVRAGAAASWARRDTRRHQADVSGGAVSRPRVDHGWLPARIGDPRRVPTRATTAPAGAPAACCACGAQANVQERRERVDVVRTRVPRQRLGGYRRPRELPVGAALPPPQPSTRPGATGAHHGRRKGRDMERAQPQCPSAQIAQPRCARGRVAP